MTGKSKCKILKDIRRQIAQDNNIEFVTSDCKYQGECSGTCPKCEAEVRYLEQELAKRQKAGKAVAVAGIAATILVSTAGCLPSQTAGDPLPVPSSSYNEITQGWLVAPTETDPTELPITMGEVPSTPQGAVPETQPTGSKIPWPTLMGVPAYDDDYEEELMGDPVPDQTEPPELMGEPVRVPEE